MIPDAGTTDAGLPAQLGTSCSLTSAEEGSDSCATYGLACTPNPDSAAGTTTGYCGFPGEYQECLTTVGCAPAFAPGSLALSCVAEGTGEPDICVYVCTSTSQCPIPYESCQDLGLGSGDICYYDFCGPTATEYDAPANGTGYFQACNNASTNDGTCLPYIFESPAYDGGFLTTGLCQANGSAAAGAACSDLRLPSGSPLCASGGQCLGDTAGDSQCFAACPTSPLFTDSCGPSCSGGGGCEPIYAGTNWGVCLEPCSSSSTCGSLGCIAL